jgi:UDP-N-acetylglucosamine/UDP-N-acetylgalactosamine diphosphorylase
MSFEQLKTKFDAAGQGHVLQFYDELSAEEKTNLLKTLSTLDVDRVNRIFVNSTVPISSQSADVLAPLPSASFDSLLTAEKEKIQYWQTKGLELIAKNQVAVILLAGGQGTRLGSSAPKGCYDIQLPSHKSLFQLQGERILSLQQASLFQTVYRCFFVRWFF